MNINRLDKSVFKVFSMRPKAHEYATFKDYIQAIIYSKLRFQPLNFKVTREKAPTYVMGTLNTTPFIRTNVKNTLYDLSSSLYDKTYDNDNSSTD